MLKFSVINDLSQFESQISSYKRDTEIEDCLHVLYVVKVMVPSLFYIILKQNQT